MIEILFWTAVAALIYLHVGYALMLAAWARLRRPRCITRAADPPSASILLVAYNEDQRLDARMRNLTQLDYPPDRIEILVASDGSTDDTVAIADAWRDRGVRLFAFGRRRGKPACLNDLVRAARGEILVMADARQTFERSALKALTAPFADPSVGAVSGALVLDGDGGVQQGVGAYWKLESFIRRQESAVDSCVGVTGAIYAVRRRLVEPIPADTLLDDVLIPMRVARRGYRVLYEPAARAHDRAAGSAGEEFTRKVRTLAGNFQLFAREPWLLVPWRNRLWLQTLSHKGLRLLGPALLGTAFVCNAALAADPFLAALLGGQVIFYGCAAGGTALARAVRVPLLAVPRVFCLLHAATVVGFVRYVAGWQRVTWERASAWKAPAPRPQARGGGRA
jgi:cellulose synthase/poly-beta-1,6-N-acetylglucosamine synthase-like glycosyltransferase